jgi:hypothetical protein
MRSAWGAVGLSVAFTALYLWASPSLAHQHWDSLEYAYAVDSRGMNAVWGNHPLGHLAQRGVYSAARTFGYTGHALPLLKGFSAVAGGAAVGALFALLAALSESRTFAGLLPALGAALIFGGSYGFWLFAGTADIYTLAALAFIAAQAALLSAALRGAVGLGVLAGALAGVATLSHQFAGVLLAVSAIGLLPVWASHPRGRAVATVASMSLSGALTLVAGYAILGSVVLDSLEPSRILTWARGYSGDPTYGRYLTWRGLSDAISAATATLAGHTTGPRAVTRGITLGAGLCWLFAGTWRLGRLPGDHRTIARTMILQCAVGWALVIWWEPGLIGKFWILLLPACLIWSWYVFRVAMTAGTPVVRRRIVVVPVAAGLLLLAYNWSNAMRFERQANVVFERSLNLWITHSSPSDVILETGRFTAHLRFWGRRASTANVYRLLQAGHRGGDPYALLRALIEDASRDHRTVLFSPGLSSYFTDDRLSVVGTDVKSLVAFFESYRWDGPIFEYQEDVGLPLKAVYRLSP